ncbi:class III lanthionine synthetase LanKC [Bacillus manliponensis]|uniref:class III lanthionine synthetase LanKC n=1 Tax=Bacillus manliponensis TaxID=574376 RepID=UPI003514E71C
MNNNQLYFKYLKPGSRYYEKPDAVHKGVVYEVTGLPESCSIFTDESSPWKFYNFKDQKIKDQGWKIHVSATLENAQEILGDISKILIERKIAFKHLIDEPTVHSVNSKNGNRISSGKFITIYPPTDEVFVELLNVLYEKVKDKENGPYILSDKCWKNSNVYYRYGGFRSIYNEKGEPCIKDESGNLIPDRRTPYYQAPKFVEEFDQFLDSQNIVDEDQDDKDKLNKYEFQKVFRHTNGGGIYLAERKEDKQKVVIKEARPKVGLDGQNKDAVDRLQVEYDTLTKLSDVEGVVNIIDYFKSWKHVFLVEEYVEGFDLKTWVSLKYPFHRKNNQEAYIADLKKIIVSLVNIVEAMHKKDVGMGDLQPSNVIIDPDVNVKLIDFESAASAEMESKAAMQTMGFASHKNKNHKERDWYAVKKILRYCVLPIGPISSLEENLCVSQNEWIEREFGRDFYLFVREIESKCDEYLSETKEKEFHVSTPSRKESSEEIMSIIEGLRKGMMNNLVPGKGLIHGDIRQSEVDGGKFNVLTGGTGAALALKRSGSIHKEVSTWIENVLMDQMYAVAKNGLFTGKAGIAATLYELGYKEESLKLFNEYMDNYDLHDVSLKSGLAGIGLAYISLYLAEDDNGYVKQAESIASYIKNYIDENRSLTVSDWAAVPIGLLDGWSGVALFYTALYAVTQDQQFYTMAKDLIERDLENTQEDKEVGILQTKDDRSRLLPYLSGGTIGIGVAIWYLNHVSGQNLYEEELKLIVNLNDIRCAFSSGLFDGIGGFLLTSLIKEDHIEVAGKNINKAVDKLDLFLIKKEDSILFPGNLCYRLSDDVYSGSAGIILALNAVLKRNPIHWLPLINIDSFIAKTSHTSEKNLATIV